VEEIDKAKTIELIKEERRHSMLDYDTVRSASGSDHSSGNDLDGISYSEQFDQPPGFSAF